MNDTRYIFGWLVRLLRVFMGVTVSSHLPFTRSLRKVSVLEIVFTNFDKAVDFYAAYWVPVFWSLV
jgi:hypothetical protein